MCLFLSDFKWEGGGGGLVVIEGEGGVGEVRDQLTGMSD